MNNIVSIDFDDKNKTNSTNCYSLTSGDKLLHQVIKSAKNIHMMLKPGLPKCVYQLKLYNDLLKKGLRLQTEMSALNLAVRQETARELIIVDETLVIECIIENRINSHHHKRIMFDLENNGYETGMLINFSDDMESEVVSVLNNGSVFH